MEGSGAGKLLGLAACLVSSISFGSMFVPVRKFPAGDGIFVQVFTLKLFPNSLLNKLSGVSVLPFTSSAFSPILALTFRLFNRWQCLVELCGPLVYLFKILNSSKTFKNFPKRKLDVDPNHQSHWNRRRATDLGRCRVRCWMGNWAFRFALNSRIMI
jgi:hypothetical protein